MRKAPYRFNWRLITLFVLFASGVTLYVTHKEALEYLSTYLPWLRENTDLVQGVEAIVNLMMLFYNAIVGYAIWLNTRTAPTQTEARPRIIERVMLDEIRASIGRGGLVTWVDRDICRPSDLRLRNRLVLSGNTRFGKSREAIELIDRAIRQDVINEKSIMKVGLDFRFVSVQDIRLYAEREIDIDSVVLLFVDNFSANYAGVELEKLSVLLRSFGRCKASYAIFVARTDQLLAEHYAWLKREAFHELRVPKFNYMQMQRLVNNALVLFPIAIDTEAVEEIVSRSGGIPEIALIALRRLQADYAGRVNLATARSISRESVVEAWEETKQYILKKMPAAEPILKSISVFHQLSIPTFKGLILDFALYLSRTSKLKPVYKRKDFGKALDFLTNFEVRLVSEVLVYPDEVVDTDVAISISSVEDFLKTQNKVLRLKWTSKRRERIGEYSTAILCLAWNYSKSGDTIAAIRLYSNAINSNPNSILFSMRGTAHRAQGDLIAALADQNKALQLNSVDPVVLFNRGVVLIDLGYLDDAMKSFEQAALLTADKMLLCMIYSRKGDVHKRVGQFAQAYRDYDRAIDFVPNDYVALKRRGDLLYDMKRYKDAINDYDAALSHLTRVDLMSEFYNSRGDAYAVLGELEKAGKDYDFAIRINPDNAKAYTGRGIIRESQGQLGSATEDYERAMQILRISTPEKLETSTILANMQYSGLGTTKAFAKRFFDLAITVTLLVALVPLLLLLMIAIRIESPGPVFSRHKYLGLGGRIITVRRFRTLRVDAEERFAQYYELQAQSQEKWLIMNDPRRSRFGQFLHRSSIDELPLLFSILRGDLSLVGPRLISLNEIHLFGDKLPALLTFKPGMTGFWQISGRSDVLIEKRINADVSYMKNSSLRSDIGIILKTIAIVIQGRGAY